MGRSPLVRRQYRALYRGQNAADTEPDPDGTEKPTFPRRFPRLGREFQTKIAKPTTEAPYDTHSASRPPAKLMSVSYPHITEAEEQCQTKEPNSECNGFDFVYIFVSNCTECWWSRPAMFIREGLLQGRESLF